MTSTPTSGHHSISAGSAVPASTANSFGIPRKRNDMHEDSDSGDEWGIEIPVGDLIMDLDTDLQNEEQRKNDARNVNNNNCVKGSGSGSVPVSTAVVDSKASMGESAGNTNAIFKPMPSSAESSHLPTASKHRSKSKKSAKSATGVKHVTSTAGSLPAKIDSHSTNDECARSANKQETSQNAKSSRSQKKHRNISNGERKADIAGSKDRERQSKAGKNTTKHVTSYSTSGASSSTNMSYTSSQNDDTSSINAKLGRTAFGNSTQMAKPNVSTAMNNNTSTAVTTPNTSIPEAIPGNKYNVTNDGPVVKAAFGKHKKSVSIPTAMKYTNLRIQGNKSPSPLSNADSAGDQAIAGKRDRGGINGGPLNSIKKMRTEKINKGYVSGMTPIDADSLMKANSSPPANAPGNSTGKLLSRAEFKMTVGQQKSAMDSKSDRRSSSRNSSNGNKNRASGSTSVSAETECATLPQNDLGNTDGSRSVGTCTTHADIGISTEPESLGPCEPGTNVNLSGIVWHETESGVLVVNVTWRNRSYVGTLLDATKHDWAPPRIPDADSDAEFRVKSGRPKRQRAANGNGLADSRKSRKAAANNNDEYKCSPSTSNKRRSNKISESDACSGNDADICGTPSKSAKRARLARTAAGKQSVQRAVNTTSAVKESSGDGTSGSGSSACSSPVFVECSFVNCKKRYSDETALKYHEAYAHKGDAEKAAEKNTRAAASPAAAGSPKSDENDESLPEPGDAAKCADGVKPMETDTAARAPFVVAQPPATITTASEIADKYAPFCAPVAVSNLVADESAFPKAKDEARPSGEYRTRPRSPNSDRETREHSPYALTDSQTSESISLKTHTASKLAARGYQHSRSYGDAQSLPGGHVTSTEHTNAVDNESAQAVETLLQLQENSHDQLPGLTQYSQPPRTAPPQAPKDAPSATSSGVHYSDTSDDTFQRGPSPPKQSNHDTGHPQYRPHSKDGAPLPRMTVRVSSPRNQYGNGQFVNVNYQHGAVAGGTTPQERAGHGNPNPGLKIVKGKTVPIPTDPQQNVSASLQHRHDNVQAPNNAANPAKKQKRKKQRPDSCPGKPPAEVPGKSLPGSSQDRHRVKQERSQVPASAIFSQGRGNRDGEGRPYLMPAQQIMQRDGDGKPEMNSPVTSRAPDCPQGHPLPGQARTKAPGQTGPRDPATQSTMPSGQSGKIPPSRAPPNHAQHSRPSHQPGHPGHFTDDRADARPKNPHARHDSHSVPGSRSGTPVGHPATRPSWPGKGQTPHGQAPPGMPPNKEAIAHALAGGRRPSAESHAEQKRGGPVQRPVHPQFPHHLLSDPYQAEFMHHPQLTEFFENVITQEYRKEQISRDQNEASLKVTRATPSPADSVKRSGTGSPAAEARKSRESPSRGQHRFPSPYLSQPPPQRTLHNAQRGGTPRASPAPSDSAPNRMASGHGAPRATPPTSHPGKRPPRPSSEAERFHRQEPSGGDRRPQTARTPTAAAGRKLQAKDAYPEPGMRSPDKKSSGPPPPLYPSPNMPMQLPGNRPGLPYYPGYSPLLDPRIAPYFPAAYMFPGAPHLFPGAWAAGGPPQEVSGPGAADRPSTAHSAKPKDRRSSDARSPFRDEGDKMSRDATRAAEVEAYAGSGDRRPSEAPTQVRKSTTPDPKAQSGRGPQGDSDGNPPMQRHHHTHHHIHEGFHVIPPPHAAQFGYPLAAPAVLAAPEATTALAPFPKREMP